MKKLFVFLLLGVFMISFASAAWEWDNSLRYENNDMKVTIENAFGLPFFGSDLGTAELKSHKSVNEVLKVAPGNNIVVMYYDFDFNEVYENGLGVVEFINMTDGKEIQKDYNFVIFDTIIEEKNNYSQVCNEVQNGTNMSKVCEQIFEGTYLEEKEGWVDFNTKDIPKGKVRIGLSTNVNLGDTIDGIWRIAGKKINRHAVWTTSLNVGLIAFFKLNETSGTTSLDSVGAFDLTESGTAATPNSNGIIDKAWKFVGGSDHLVSGINTNISGNDPRTLSAWVNFTTIGGGLTAVGIGHDANNNQFAISTAAPNNLSIVGFGNDNVAAIGTLSVGVWFHLVATFNGTTLKAYINGDEVISVSESYDTTSHPIAIGARDGGVATMDGIIDEVGVWTRALSPAEVTQLYNGGSAITWINESKTIEITLNSPENNFTTVNQTIIFNTTINATNLEVVSVSLLLDGEINETNSSGFLGDYIFEKNLEFGNHNWSINVVDNETNTTSSSTQNFTLIDGSASAIWTDEYQVRIIATDLTESDFEINNVVVTQEGDTLWKINTTESDYEVARAQVMKTFFYGTDGNDPRINRTTGLLKIQSQLPKDSGKRGHYISMDYNNKDLNPAALYTGTFSDTTTNTDCSSWSKLIVDFPSTGNAQWEIAQGTIRNIRTSTGTTDELGTDTSSDEINNPADSQLESNSNTGDADASIQVVLLCSGSISWVASGDLFPTVLNRDFNINESIPDTSPMPNITLNAPEDNAQEINGQPIIFNITSTISGTLKEISLFINGVLNETILISGTENTTTFNKTFLTLGNNNWNVKVCDINNNCALSENRTFTINSFAVNSIDFNAGTFETKNESFILNITTNGTAPTSSILVYDSESKSTTIEQEGLTNNYIITSSFIIPVGIDTKSFFFNVTLSGDVQNTTTNNQVVNGLFFVFCNATITSQYINFSFKNETTNEESINATIDSLWTFWLTDGTVTKSVTLTNSSENINYAICSSAANDTLKTNVTLNYNNANSQQRSFVSEPILTNSTTQQVLYLLPSGLGLFSQFQTRDIANNPISLVKGTIKRTLGSSIITVASFFTDSSGIVVYFLNPDVIYTATFSKEGFSDNTFTFVPTTDLRFVTMGTGVVVNGSNISIGTLYEITPISSTLTNNTLTTFGFNVTAGDGITFISMNITDGNGTSFAFNSNAGIGFISVVVNTSNNMTLTGIFEIRTGDENFTISKLWVIGNEFEGDYSISKQGKLYLQYGFSDFMRLSLVILIIFGIVIFMSSNELADNNESKIAVVVLLIWAFSTIGWLNNPAVVSTTGIAQYARQYGIAILSTAGALFFFIRRIFV